MHSILKKENLIEYQEVKEFKPKYQMKIGQFFYSSGISTYFTRIFFHNGTKRKNSLIGLDTSYTTHFKGKKPSRQTKNLQNFQKLAKLGIIIREKKLMLAKTYIQKLY